MNAALKPRVEIEDRIRQQADLLSAVNNATEFLENQAVTVPLPSVIGWRFADRDGQLIEVALSDSDDPGSKTVRRNFWTRWIKDPVNSKLCVLKIWGELLSYRSDRNMARINERISRLEEEEADGE